MPLPAIRPAQIEWQDDTPCARDYGDVYFSRADGFAESRYVFIDGNRLPERWRDEGDFTIAETGFGSGLNFLLSAQLWLQRGQSQDCLHYISVEKHPLTQADLQRAIDHWPQLAGIGQALLDAYPPLVAGQHRLTLFDGRIQLDLLFGEASACLSQLHCPRGVDAWFLDGFAPSKNPDMWQRELFDTLSQLSHPATTLATFTAAGDVRRGLIAAGWQIHKRSGFGKKREMLCGQRAPGVNTVAPRAPWLCPPSTIECAQQAIVIGAGLAGCASAHALAKRGWQVTLIERAPQIAAGASGNLAGVVMPRLSADMGDDACFYLSAFLHTVRALGQLRHRHPQLDWQASGVHQQASAAQLAKLRDLPLPPEVLQCDEQHLIFPAAGWLSPPQLCQTLLDDVGAAIDLQCQHQALSLNYTSSQWQVSDGSRVIAQAPVVILANGYDATRLFPGHALQLHKVRGQLAYLQQTAASATLHQPLCFDGYVLPAYHGLHVTGATYRHHSDDEHIDEAEAVQLKTQLAAQLPQFSDSPISGGRVAFRTSSPDRLPLVGALPDLDFFCQRYADLHHGKPADHYPTAQHLPGLYLNSGHGSRGLTSCLLAADIITALIEGRPAPIPRHLLDALNPARFLIRNLKRGQQP